MGLGIVVPRPVSLFADQSAAQGGAGGLRKVLVLSNPIHTDIALPADPDVLEAFSFVGDAGLDLDHPGVFWVVFGWGSRSFYIETPTWDDLKPGPVINALTWDASVMHVRRAGDIPVDLPDVRVLTMSEEQFDTLLKEIRQSFAGDETEVQSAIPEASYDAHDIFFPAKGGFNALMGCNTWTARMLRLAGFQTGVWTPLPMTLMWSIDLHNELPQPD